MIEAFKLVGQIALEGGKAVDDSLGNLEKKLNNASDKFKNAGKKTSDFGKKLAPVSGIVAGAGAGLLALAVSAGDYADGILDASDITGMSTDKIQEWEYVTKIAGISGDSFTKMSKQLTKQMTSLTDGTGKGAEALDELGISADELSKASPDDQIDMVVKALQGIDDPAERARLGTDLLKGSYADIAPALGMGADGLAEVRKEANETGSVMEKDALVTANDFRIGMEKLKTQLANVGRELAVKFIPIFEQHVLPVLQQGIEVLKKVGEWISNLSPTTIKWIAGIGALVAILAPAIIFLGMLLGAVGNILPWISRAITLFRMLNLTLLANPITWIVLGVLALIAVGILLYKNWDTVVAFLSKAWNLIKTKATEIFAKIRDAIVTKFNEVKTRVQNKIQEIRDGIQSRINDIKTRITDRFNEIKDNIIKKIEDAKNGAINKFNELKTRILTPIQEARDKISEIVEKIKGFFTGLKLNIPKPKLPSLPSFRIEGKLDLLNLPPKIPKLKVDWRARGGYLDSATLIGAGERGREVILPLDNRRYMKPFSDAVSENLKTDLASGGAKTQIEIPLFFNGREIARAFSDDINRELERKRQTSKRGGR